ncbi:alpha/beta hydrolase [Ferruginibacter paludis]|uniref:alpha/beta hydrolase n=1 Tax=Ferruginibacter paludis TaxID=1310417 RepID=UPI0025B5DB89|nr:alpha/beta hydrolase [Ferruginibacter paludis]MDN3656141.1 alpha/beta hydrolase [Ferruginibacter paludis]
MKTKIYSLKLKVGVALLSLIVFCTSWLLQPAQAQTKEKINNIVIVHGAFADGSGWEEVYNILTRKGYHVTIVQNPLSSLEDDVAATNYALERQQGPAILVGHSWGGTVITQAGVSPKVIRLVYIAAFQPEVGETTGQLASSEPAAPENGIMLPDENGLIYYSKEKFHKGFAGDLSKEKADFMYDSQGAIAVKCFTTPVTVAAWKTKPTYAVVATEDKSINPTIERKMYKRAGSIVTEINGSHAVFMSQSKKVAAVIEAAVLGTGL